MRVSVIVPTYREAENLPELLERLGTTFAGAGLEPEVLVMDDDSRDGTEAFMRDHAPPWARLIVRTAHRGLSPAVVDGLRAATGDVMVVMDADLSHPPETIPELVAAARQGDFAIGSRYVAGGTTEEGWGFLRVLNSRVATLMAMPLAPLSDPMSGFFALRREIFERARYLNPVGYKIGLELLVKCRCRDVREVPIHFANRKHGESKLSAVEQLKYIQHLRRLHIFRYPESTHLLQFLVVAVACGLLNLAVLTVLHWSGVPLEAAVATGIAAGLLSEFGLNRRFSFSFARWQNVWRQFGAFIAVGAVGGLLNYTLTLALLGANPGWAPQAAAALGIGLQTAVNYVLNRLFVFKKQKRMVASQVERAPAAESGVTPASGPAPCTPPKP